MTKQRNSINILFNEILYKCRIFEILDRFLRQQIRILMYHRFSYNFRKGFVSVKELEKQLKYLKQRFTLVSLDAIASIYIKREKISEDLVAITVDDGYLDFYDVAYPVFLKHKIPVTVFLCTDFIDRKRWMWADKIKYLITQDNEDNVMSFIKDEIGEKLKKDCVEKETQIEEFFEVLYKMRTEAINILVEKVSRKIGVQIPSSIPKEYSPMDWHQIREMVDNGIEIGAHGCSHSILTNLSYNEAYNEVRTSKEIIEDKISYNVNLFCYPNGNTNRIVKNIVSNAGFKCAVITQYGFNDINSDRYALTRIGVGNLPFVYYVKSLSGFEEIKSNFNSKIMALRK